MNRLLFIFFGCCFFCATSVSGQEDPSVNVIDDVQVDVKSARTNTKGDTLHVDLFLISYKMNQREFKLNTYATQVIDEDGTKYLFASIKMGRVLVQLADRQNYLHYLLEENTPVPLTINVANWKGKKARMLYLVYEDSAEEGKFITQEVQLN